MSFPTLPSLKRTFSEDVTFGFSSYPACEAKKRLVSPPVTEEDSENVEVSSPPALAPPLPAVTMTSLSSAVLSNPNLYEPYFDRAKDVLSSPVVELEYPGQLAQESFVLVCPSLNNWKKQRKYAQHLSLCYDPIQDLLRTISIVTEHVLLFNLEAGGKRSECLYQEASTIAQRVRKAFILRDLDQVLLAIQAYNELIRSYRKLKLGPVVVEEEEEKAEFFNPPALVEHLIHQVYSRMASPFAELLREYRAFSDNVYGELNPILVTDMVKEAKITSKSVFLDLGSGIGNVAFQIASLVGCEVWGIEMMDNPARIAELQLAEYKVRTKGYGVPSGSIEFLQGDFTADNRIPPLLARCTHVLANNYAFTAELNQKLMQLFLELPDGAKIMCLKSFIPKDHKITFRNADSVCSILTVRELWYPSGGVSWTNREGKWYMHEVQRSLVSKFWSKNGN